MVIKMKHSKEAKEEVKKRLLQEQGFVCPLCKGSLRGIPLSKQALDHCHNTGNVRAVLHMGCNRAEGVILGAAHTWARCASVPEQVSFVERLASYWKYHRENPSGLIYPTHKTPEEKKLAAKKKAMAAAKKRKLTRSKNVSK